MDRQQCKVCQNDLTIEESEVGICENCQRMYDPVTGEILKQEDFHTVDLPVGMALVKVAPGMDVTIQSLGEEALKLSMYANNLTVTNLEEEKRATNDLVMCRGMIKDTETEQKRWLEPVKDAEGKIKAAFNLILAPLKTANETMTQKVTTFRKEEKRKADEAAEITRKKAELAAMEAKAKGEEPPPPVVEYLAPEQAKTHESGLGKTTMAGTWKFRWKPGLSQAEIIKALPPQYLIPNETLIGQIVRGKGKNNVTEKDFGDVIEIYFEEGIRITGRRS